MWSTAKVPGNETLTLPYCWAELFVNWFWTFTACALNSSAMTAFENKWTRFDLPLRDHGAVDQEYLKNVEVNDVWIWFGFCAANFHWRACAALLLRGWAFVDSLQNWAHQCLGEYITAVKSTRLAIWWVMVIRSVAWFCYSLTATKHNFRQTLNMAKTIIRMHKTRANHGQNFPISYLKSGITIRSPQANEMSSSKAHSLPRILYTNRGISKQRGTKM